ncbi:hypothetical protein ABT160_31195 [Streptomyces sp. NPDC001941]|uniref:hypothetical protein n=1 Tax=Streptomyces sp. NPDC001941 TaxID=3154659 RepID=UPI003320D6F2
MEAIDDTTEPDSPFHGTYPPLVEAAWLYQAEQVCLEDLPMTAAQALATGMDTPALCELAGLARHEDPRDIRDAFERALEELGILLPSHNLSRRYALSRLASRFTAGEVDLAELVSDEWSQVRVETAQEQAFVALLPPCACCIEFTLGLDEAAWEAQLRIAACALVSQPAVGPRL